MIDGLRAAGLKLQAYNALGLLLCCDRSRVPPIARCI